MADVSTGTPQQPSRKRLLEDLAALVERKHGKLTRPERLKLLGRMVGREVPSSWKLTGAEVRSVMERLRAERDTCPTPRKIRYATAVAARKGADAAEVLRGGDYRPYCCLCGWWHLTTHSKGGRLRVASDGRVYKRKRRPEGGA